LRLLEHLRTETADAHDGLERTLAVEGLDRPRYVRLLERLLGYHLRIERRFDEVGIWTRLGIDGGARRRVPALIRDLDLLAGSCARVVVPMGRYFPALDPARAAGAVYVLEGSTLGATVVPRVLRDIDVTPDAGGRYFGGYGVQTGPRWKETCAALTAFGATNDVDAIVDGARVTFAALRSWLCEEPWQ
jgi:heme oxygenase